MGARRFTFLSTCGAPWGGSEELWSAAARELRGRDHSVEALKTVVPHAHPRVRELRSIGCPVRDLDHVGVAAAGRAISVAAPTSWRMGRERSRMVRAAGRLLAARPELVVISQGQNFDGTHYGRVARALRLPYVLIAQKASDLVWPPDDVRAYHARGYRQACEVIFVSEHNRTLTEQQLGLRLDDAIILRNPVRVNPDTASAAPASPGDELRLACVARLDIFEKGQDILLRVLARERWRERRLRVDFYGDGPNRLALEDLSRQLGVRGAAFPGSVGDIGLVWRDHHALVLSSRGEGTPLALVEAMMCGRPAVVTDVGGCAEFVEDGVSGFVAADPTVNELDAALERLWQRRMELATIGAAAKRRAQALVATDPARRLADLLERLA